MTNLEQLKQSIGYTKVNKQCQNCEFFNIDIIPSFMVEKNLRCKKYNFATKKTTTCNSHKEKEINV